MNIAASRRAVAAGATIVALSGCGALSPGGDFVDQGSRSMAEAAFAAMSKVTSVRILGSQEGDTGFTRVDLRVNASSCVGRLSSDQGSLEVVKNTQGAWFSGDEDFWLAQGAVPRLAEAYAGEWVAVEGKAKVLKLCHFGSLIEAFELDDNDTDDTIDVGEVVEIGDAEAVPLTGQEGKQRVTVWVDVAAPHHVLKIAPANDGGRPDALYFEELGDDVVAESPAKKDVITLPGS